MNKGFIQVPHPCLEGLPHVFCDGMAISISDRKVRVDTYRDVSAQTVAHPSHLATVHTEHSMDRHHDAFDLVHLIRIDRVHEPPVDVACGRPQYPKDLPAADGAASCRCSDGDSSTLTPSCVQPLLHITIFLICYSCN